MAEKQCPECGSDALNLYGHTKNGKQRYICLVCNRQFIDNHAVRRIDRRPECPKCSKPMHVYMRAGNSVRFRCSDYPECRGYTKIAEEN